MKDFEPTAHILWHYVQNIELTIAEKEELNLWLHKTTARKILFDELSDRELWLSSIPPELRQNPEASLFKIKEKLKNMK